MGRAVDRRAFVLGGSGRSGLRAGAWLRAPLAVAVVAVGLVLPASHGLAQTVEWTRQFGTSAFDGAQGVAVDPSGNAYVAGRTGGTLPGQTSAGGNDAFVAKYDPSGAQLWVRQFGTSAFDAARGVAVDFSGNVYLTGPTEGTFPGQTSAGSLDAFLAKYDSSGAQLWVRQFGGSSADVPLGVAVDSSGNAYMGGQTYGTFPGQTSAGDNDAFVARYDPSGARQWVRQFGTPASDEASGVAVDSSGDVYVTGGTLGAFPGQASSGDTDAFVAKYDSAGTELWVRQFGTSAGDGASAVAVDSSGNAYAVGQTFGIFPGQTRAGGDDAFVAKYDPSGAQLWVRQFGTGAAYDSARGVALDSSGNAYIAGVTFGTFPGQSLAGNSDAFVADYDPSGNQLWVRQFGTADLDEVGGVAVDSSGNAYVAGITRGAFPGQTSAGGFDAFVAKVSPPSPPGGSCIGHAATIDRSPSSGGETINGTSGDDVIVATSGPDTINGNGGNDIICAGPGDDVITTGSGDDDIRGQDGRDTIRAGSGNDRAWGNAGDDHLFAGPGDDWAKGGTGDDVVRGQGGNDQVFGNDGADGVYGNDGNDTVDGGSGNDAVRGGRGIDNCAGGERLSGCETIS